MGTSIELTIGPVSLNYAKNFMGADFGHLFQEGDLTRRWSDQRCYDHLKGDPNADEATEGEESFVRVLSRVIPRLRILGHSIESARAEYAAIIADAEGNSAPDAENQIGHLSFEDYCELACLYPVTSLADDYIDFETHDRARVAQGRFAAYASQFERVPWNGSSNMYWSEASFLADKLCILSPESMLEVFALNPDNANAEVVWQFGPIVESGWNSRESFQGGARRSQRILVATEGSSDGRIIRRALEFLRPDLADFFRFIDGNERHHFWGTGNLIKFAEGLLRIDVQNQVLFVFDNDAEGVDAHRKLAALSFPANMRSMLLPDIEDFKCFPALGPEGSSFCNINGRAAAIECYLDLNIKRFPPARVIWSNYKKELEIWHGALEYKDSYTNYFLEQSSDDLIGEGYDSTKLEILLDALVAEASQLLELP